MPEGSAQTNPLFLVRLYYHRAQHGNFGDDLNAWLWPEMAPELFRDNEEDLFVGIGTILNDKIPKCPSIHVFGSGFGYGSPPSIDRRWTIHCVRGPLTARALGLDPNLAATDPAILVRRLLPHSLDKQHKIAFMPHHESIRHAPHAGKSIWEWGCQLVGIHFIDPTAPLDDVLTAIQRSELLITEAMHGAIVADALRVPWIPVRFHQHILAFKWRDWCQSMDLEYHPACLRPPLSSTPSSETSFQSRLRRKLSPPLFSIDLRRIAKKYEPVLSSRSTLDASLDRLEALLARLRRDYTGR